MIKPRAMLRLAPALRASVATSWRISASRPARSSKRPTCSPLIASRGMRRLGGAMRDGRGEID
ncbi:hypothetical protein [Sphingomonas sp. ERG5]|uniref:hypothetical protein n=1 Tax=Sphingomonas sp. ERG5 TaxID=1381597 RepID=UPI00126A7140|nr:hypothetical protein [Sphingomonas sp. ERG5]